MMKCLLGLLCFAVLPGCGDDEADGAVGPGGTAGVSGDGGGQAGSAGVAGHSGASGHAGAAGQAGAVGCPSLLPEAVAFNHDADVGRFRVQNDPPGSDLGTFDPSFVLAADGSHALSYTSVDLARNKLHTRIAVSSDGSSFAFVAEANSAQQNVQVEVLGDPDCPGGVCNNATIIHEVSGLIEDVSDPDATARWKLFTHSYVTLEPDPQDPNTPRLRYPYGHIRLAVAPAPSGPWSEPAPMIGWPSAAPFSSEAPVLVTDIDGMQECLMLTEPSAAIDEDSGALELAVGCVVAHGAAHAIRIDLLRSTDHGATWSRAHPLLDGADAICIGAESPEINAAHLFTRGGQRYLIATPAGTVTFPGGATGSGYRGCLVFRRTPDGVERDAEGAPIVVGLVDPGDGVFAGACSHHPLGGYVASVLSFASPPDLFRMFGPVGQQLP